MNIQEFDYFTDIKQSILWQYNEATNLLSLINQKQSWYDEYLSVFWALWELLVFDLQTCDVFGAAIWSILLDVPLFIHEDGNPAQPTWGFNAYDPTFPDLLNTYLNFENGNFSSVNQELSLSLEQQKFLLRLRYFQLSTLTNIAGMISDDYPGIYSINWFLNYLCTNNEIDYAGTIYVIDNLDMTITYHFTSDSFPGQLFTALVMLDLFPRPAGVGVTFTGL